MNAEGGESVIPKQDLPFTSRQSLISPKIQRHPIHYSHASSSSIDYAFTELLHVAREYQVVADTAVDRVLDHCEAAGNGERRAAHGRGAT